MSKKSHTPPCHKQSKSPHHNNHKSISRRDINWARTPYAIRATNGSRSTSRLNNQSERAYSKNRRDKKGHKQFLSLGRKKESLSNAQLTILVNQYENLKTAYEGLLHTKRSQSGNRSSQLIQENVRIKKQNEKLRNQNEYFKEQLQRIKKECVKLIEIEGFKIKKLEETLQEKQLMLQFLRNQGISAFSNGSMLFQSTPIFKVLEVQKSLPTNLSLLSLEQISAIQIAERNNFLLSQIHGENKITISSDDSLVFSKDKSKSNNIYLESMHISSPYVKEDLLHKIEINCPTFDIKELESDKLHQLIISEEKSKRKNLKIDTDTKSFLNPIDHSDDLITNSTKKKINISIPKEERENLINSQNIQKRRKKNNSKLQSIDRIDVNLPSKDKKSTVMTKHNKALR